MPEARIDKWMWATRIFKTRTIAAEACKKGRICINGAQAKPSRMVKPGDVIQVKKPPITYSFKVLQAIEKRVGAKLVPEMMENVTTPDQYELLEMSKISGFVGRAKGTGRPTKKTVVTWMNSLHRSLSEISILTGMMTKRKTKSNQS
jgi:ribosome-associated heat shock protein Hsp15